MTALELITIWYKSKKIDLALFHLLQRNIIRAPFTRFGLNIHNISAERLIELIKSGEIAGIYGMGEKRVEVLKSILKPKQWDVNPGDNLADIINVAENSDTIVVSPGTYTEAL